MAKATTVPSTSARRMSRATLNESDSGYSAARLSPFRTSSMPSARRAALMTSAMAPQSSGVAPRNERPGMDGASATETGAPGWAVVMRVPSGAWKSLR